MRHLLRFYEIFEKNATYVDIKNKALHSLQTVYFLKYILKVKAQIFFNKMSILFFAELAIFHYIQIKTSLGKIVKKITREKVWCLIYAFWYLPTYFLVFADVCFLVF